jgi:MtN3 and saliva related transmembrane protein
MQQISGEARRGQGGALQDRLRHRHIEPGCSETARPADRIVVGRGTNVDQIEVLSFSAGFMTTGAPITQVFKTVRSRDYAGLSVGSYLLLLLLGTFAVLVGVQYHIVAMEVFNSVALAANMLMMLLISRWTLAAFVLTLGGLALLSALFAPWFIPALLTTRWAEQVAFVYGLIAAATFLPQVLLTHRTKVVSSLSLINLTLFAGGMAVWIVVSYMLGNYSLIGWNIILLLMILELLRLKIVLEGRTEPDASVTFIRTVK